MHQGNLTPGLADPWCGVGWNDLLRREIVGVGSGKRQGSIQEFPRICPIEPPDDDRLQQRWFKVSEIHAMASAGRGLERLPMRGDTASLAPNIPQGPIAPDIAFRVLGVAFDGDRAKFIEGPYASRPPTQRAVAARGGFWRGRQRKAYRAAVAGTVQ